MLDGVPKEITRIDDILVRISHIQLIEDKVCIFFFYSCATVDFSKCQITGYSCS